METYGRSSFSPSSSSDVSEKLLSDRGPADQPETEDSASEPSDSESSVGESSVTTGGPSTFLDISSIPSVSVLLGELATLAWHTQCGGGCATSTCSPEETVDSEWPSLDDASADVGL